MLKFSKEGDNVITKLDSKKCTGCSACKSACPVNAIKMVQNNEGFYYPKIDFTKCIKCNRCSKICPVMNKQKNAIIGKTYACYNKNYDEKSKSSSGGIFILLAKYILRKQGVVYGAAFNKDFHVHHIKVDNAKNIQKLMGSKYVQSSMDDIYDDVKIQLSNDKLVLFSGTPCQIEGLISFLGKRYNNLYTIDIVCHGVPSPLVWEKYIEYRRNVDKEKPIKISFRNKDTSWKLFNIKFTYKKRVPYSSPSYKDPYMKLFLDNISLRKSCYNCAFKDKYKKSDITLGDLWGVDYFEEIDFEDKNGVSLLIVNTEKGKELLKAIDKNIISSEININRASEYNSAIIESVIENKKRDSFFKDLSILSTSRLLQKYAKEENFFKKIIKKILRLR